MHYEVSLFQNYSICEHLQLNPLMTPWNCRTS